MNLKIEKQTYVQLLLPVVVCIIGVHFSMLGLCGTDLSLIPGDLGDARFNMYVLEHGFQFITGHIRHFWDAPEMFPAPHVLAYSDNLLGSMPLYAFFRMLTIDRETSFQLWMISLSVLNFAAAFYTLKKMSSNFILACAGAYVFAFSIFLYTQYNHAQMFPRFIIPFVFYWTILFFQTFRVKYIAFLVFGTIYEFYCGMYLGFFLFLAEIILILVLLFMNLKKMKASGLFSLKKISWLGLILLAGTVSILPLALPYMEIHAQTGDRNFSETFSTIPLPSSYFFASSRSITWKSLSTFGINLTPRWFDQQIFIGAIPWLAFIAAAVFFFRKKFFKNNSTLFSILLTLVLAIILTMRFGNFSLFRWVFMLPGFYSIGCVSRIINIYVFLFSMVLCLFLASVVTKNRTLWFSLVLVAVIVDNLSNPDQYFYINKKEIQSRLVSIITKVNYAKADGKVAFAYLSDSPEKIEVHVDAMMASQVVHLPCINGYSPMCPEGYGDFWTRTDEQSLKQWLDINQIPLLSVIVVR